MKTFIKKARIVTNEEVREYCIKNGLTEKEVLSEALKNNPPKFHERIKESIHEIYHHSLDDGILGNS